MKQFLKLCLGSLCFSMLFNLIGNKGIKLERFGTYTYSVWTITFALAIIIAALLIRIGLKIAWIKWQKKYPELELFKDGKLQLKEIPLGERLLVVFATTVALLLVYLCFIYLIAYAHQSSNSAMLFKSYLYHYIPKLGISCFLYVYYVFKKGDLWCFTPQHEISLFGSQLPARVVELEKIVEKVVPVVHPSVLDQKIVIGSLYDILYGHAKFEPDFTRKKAVRMFDVPFYFSTRGEKEVILVDGTRRKADRFMQELEAIGLDKWYFRISSSCRVNMMLVRYPVAHNAGKLELRKEVFDNLQQAMNKMDIQKLLVATQWIRKNKKITKFLDNVNNLEHKGWDYLIPLD
ncbi:hypothetical protein [Sphingobacterium sp. UGAL515B_05]|uniref:hypothetical protein n=1 Tax=Sphingobacterium sp. UGAL515B_05 TaxID=2986767 RepID=UPI0029548187|nr:hypothetical protein [Sphingobacterium sp. UGAL515B_05]WON93659.1 hypothetical protein OK025_20725 [Sphingobacterium sp. UGAL515B_05]